MRMIEMKGQGFEWKSLSLIRDAAGSAVTLDIHRPFLVISAEFLAKDFPRLARDLVSSSHVNSSENGRPIMPSHRSYAKQKECRAFIKKNRGGHFQEFSLFLSDNRKSLVAKGRLRRDKMSFISRVLGHEARVDTAASVDSSVHRKSGGSY
jgi:hypothetical protein